MVNYEDSEMQEVYLEQLKENYQNPENIGKLKNYTFLVHYKNPSCGDTFNLYVLLKERRSVNGEVKMVIDDVKYSGEGCAISTASMSLFSQKLIGMNFEDSKKFVDKDIYDMLGVKISPGRINCAMLSLNAFKKGYNSLK